MRIQIAKLSDILLPKAIQKIPYSISLFLARLVLNKYKFLWARHSFIENNIIFPLSDVDLTLYSEDTSQKFELSLFGKLRRIFLPLIGEFNFFYRQDLLKCFSVLNPFVLQRDPILLKKIAASKILLKKEHSIVFTARLLISDEDNLADAFSLRIHKWNFHLEQINSRHSLNRSSDVFGLINLLAETVEEGGAEFINYFNEYFLLKIGKKEFQSTEMRDLDIVFNFNKFLRQVIENNELNYHLDGMCKKSKPFQEIILAQLEWELWGVISQLGSPYLNIREAKDHLMRLSQISDYLELANTNNFFDSLSYLKSRLDSL